MSSLRQWRRVGKSHRCPVCGRADWCLISLDATAAICPRSESNRRVGQAGYLHVLEHRREWTPRPRRIALSPWPLADHAQLAAFHQRATAKCDAVDRLANRLGVSPASLVQLCVGWSVAECCWTFPLRDGSGTKIIGLNRRFTDGGKRVMRHHRIGLYVPIDLPLDLWRQTLLITEGGSDAAAGFDLGFWTVGRFSCNTGREHLCTLAVSRGPGRIVVCADTGNELERKGAAKLASAMRLHATDVRLIEPPPPHRDLRSWHNAGAKHGDLDQLIGSAPSHKLRVTIT